MKILMVLTSHDQLGNTGKKTGFWLEELAAPYYTFKDAGADIVLASPKGGQPPVDPKSDEPSFQTDSTRRLRRTRRPKRNLHPPYGSITSRRRSSIRSSTRVVTVRCGISRKIRIRSH